MGTSFLRICVHDEAFYGLIQLPAQKKWLSTFSTFSAETTMMNLIIIYLDLKQKVELKWALKC